MHSDHSKRIYYSQTWPTGNFLHRNFLLRHSLYCPTGSFLHDPLCSGINQGFSTSAVRLGLLGVGNRMEQVWLSDLYSHTKLINMTVLSLQGCKSEKTEHFNKWNISESSSFFVQLLPIVVDVFAVLRCSYKSMKVAPGITTMWNWFERVRKKDTDPGDRMYFVVLISTEGHLLTLNSVVVSNIFLFPPIPGEDSHFD